MTKYPLAVANTIPAGTESINFCMFCGASNQGFPFASKDNSRELYDVLSFHNVDLPKYEKSATFG